MLETRHQEPSLPLRGSNGAASFKIPECLVIIGIGRENELIIESVAETSQSLPNTLGDPIA